MVIHISLSDAAVQVFLNVTFNVFSPHNYETINLFADGPCGVQHFPHDIWISSSPTAFVQLAFSLLIVIQDVNVTVTQNCLHTSLTATQLLNLL